MQADGAGCEGDGASTFFEPAQVKDAPAWWSTRAIRTLVVDDDYRVARIHAAFVERTEDSRSPALRTAPNRR